MSEQTEYRVGQWVRLNEGYGPKYMPFVKLTGSLDGEGGGRWSAWTPIGSGGYALSVMDGTFSPATSPAAMRRIALMVALYNAASMAATAAAKISAPVILAWRIIRYASKTGWKEGR